jgi:hypothetical protein
MLKMDDERKIITEEEFCEMVGKLKEIDLCRLLVNLQAMVSTIRLYKIANSILLTILKTTPLS